MVTRYTLVVTFVILSFCKFSGAQYRYTLCTTSRHFEACEQINRTNSIQCIVLGDEASCIERINRGDATFASLSPEGAFLGVTRENLLTLATFQRETESVSYDYQTAIATNVNVENGTNGLRNFSYCHPGFDVTSATPYTLLEFEKQLLSDNGIDICEGNGGTIAENHIKALNDFFGPSCRPGKWVQDAELDRRLKDKYPKLTRLCNSPAYQNHTGRAFLQSLECVRNSNEPAVGLTTLTTILTEKQNRNFTVYSLCRNGTTSNNTDVPFCEWSTIPHRIVVANKDNYGDLPVEFIRWFVNSLNAPQISNPIQLSGNQVTLLKQILFPDITYNIVVEDSSNLQSLPQYLSAFRRNLTIQDLRLCKNETRWCTISNDEQRKCEVWSRATLNYLIQPVLSCVQKSNKRDCIDAISANTADAVTIAANYGYFAKRQGLVAIAFPETVEESLIRTVLLVRPGITRFENLRGKRGCFSQYGGAAWLSFIDAGRNIILSRDTCEYAKLLSDALGDSCMPGAGTIPLDNVCSLCVSSTNISEPSCATDSTNKYFGNQGALDCLRDVGDFAVITVTDDLIIPENVTVMCKNGTVTNSSSLNLDYNCFLTVITTDEIVTRRVDLSNPNIQLALLDYDRHFAADISSPFKLFGVFDGIKDLLFRDSTPGLDLPSSTHSAIKNYIALFSHVDECLSRDGGYQLLPSLMLVVLSTILLLRI